MADSAGIGKAGFKGNEPNGEAKTDARGATCPILKRGGTRKRFVLHRVNTWGVSGQENVDNGRGDGKRE
jgi:hypothetical protein